VQPGVVTDARDMILACERIRVRFIHTERIGPNLVLGDRLNDQTRQGLGLAASSGSVNG